MGRNKIGIVFKREYMVKVKKKSFIILTLLVPLLFAALMLIPSLIMLWGGDDQKKVIAFVDESGIVADSLISQSDNFELVRLGADQYSSVGFEELKTMFNSLGYDAIAHVTVKDSTSMELETSMYSDSQVSLDMQHYFNGIVNDAVTEYRLSKYDIAGLREILDSVESNVKASTYMLGDESEDEHESLVEVYMVLGYICSFAIYMFILMFSSGVMMSVIEEKATRVVEVLVSSVKPFQLMMGKILGSAAVGLTQFAIWIVLTAVLVFGAATIFGGSVVSQKAPNPVEQVVPAEVMEQTGVQTIDMASAGAIAGEIVDQSNEDSGASAIISDIFETLKGVHIGMLLLGFALYFLFGYLLYAALFAAIGSAVENQADTQQLTLPVTIPLIIGLLIMLSTFQNPDSSLSFWASMIPFTSPVVMMARLPYGIPVWEFALSMGILIATFIGITWICARIYRVGILQYGTKASWKDMFKWIRIK
ncbi:MAG: ABC transporter permease [Bacteroidales bacterium]|nr:ABC transporter permease [Bacteroidales bacterium]